MSRRNSKRKEIFSGRKVFWLAVRGLKWVGEFGDSTPCRGMPERARRILSLLVHFVHQYAQNKLKRLQIWRRGLEPYGALFMQSTTLTTA